MIQQKEITLFDIEELRKVTVDASSIADDFFDYSKVVVKKPWGYEYLMYQNGTVAVWILYIKKGFQTSMHCHPAKKTSLIVLSGEALCSTLDGEVKRTPGDGLLLARGVFHRTQSLSEEGIFVMEIETPVNKRDLVRLKDKYGRVGKGYETVNEMSFNQQNYNYVSFIEPSAYYNIKKKFGQCSITLKKHHHEKNFEEMLHYTSAGALCVLKGKIKDNNGNILADVGDTIDLEQIRDHKNCSTEAGTEVIIVQKRDTIIKLSDYVVSFLEKNKVKELFLVPGSSNVHLLDSVGRNTNIQHICTQTEEAATITAESYAKTKRELGVAIIASGTCTTRALTGVADAWVDSAPLMVISGQAPSDQTIENSSLRQLGVQELGIINIVQPITKYAVKVTDATTIKFHLEKAVYLATEGRPGPVWIDLPIDIQGMNFDEEELTSFYPPEETGSQKTELQEKAAEMLRLLQESKRPVLLAGGGIRTAKAENYFMTLINRLSIPVLTSRNGSDLLPETCPLFFGRPGAYGQRSANFILQNADLLISIGTRLSLPLIGRNYKAFAREAKKVIVDIDEQELVKKTIKPSLAVQSCAGEFIREVISQLYEYSPKEFPDWFDKCRTWKEKYLTEKRSQKEGTVDAYSFIELLSRELVDGTIVTVDGGSPLIIVMQQFRFKQNQRLIAASGLDNPNFALPAAVGAYIGSNRKEVICICDDQGFQKNIQELETIMRYNLPIRIFVLNSQGYSYVRKTQQMYFGGRYVASDKEQEQTTPEITKIVENYGIATFSILTNKEVLQGIKKTLGNNGPVVCTVNIDKNQEIVPRITFTVTSNGKWSAKPLEDMCPFLDRKELKENMFISLVEEE